MIKKKILFIANYEPDTVPGQRFRFEQYFSFLEQNGFECTISYILSEEEIRMLHRKGNYPGKSFVMLKGFFKRLTDLFHASKYDIIFIFREAFFAGPIFFETMLALKKIPIVYDFDDAIWIDNVSYANRYFKILKNSGKIPEIIRKATVIFAGNPYLAEFAGNYNKNVKIIPTTIDTEKYLPRIKSNSREKICIGWSGSVTTIQHFELAIPFLNDLKKKYGEKIYFKVIGDASYINKELTIHGIPWKQKTEIEDLSEIDIGIMPLPDDEWAKGKCGLKGLQYMALEIPTVMSPVGVNSEIIQDGKNGFLAHDHAGWIQKISQLIDSAPLREQMGKEGRKTVVQHYSCSAIQNSYLQNFRLILRA